MNFNGYRLLLRLQTVTGEEKNSDKAAKWKRQKRRNQQD